jgi:carbamoyltransferase
MKVCGVSAHFHDSAAALLVDGRLVAAAQEERFSRRKGDPGLPLAATRFCLAQAGLEARELDALVFYEKPLRKFLRILATALANAPRGGAAFRGALHAWFEHKLWIRSDLARALGLPREKVVFGDHHLSHAAAPFLTHELESAAFLVVDAVGEWSTTSLGRLARTKDGLAYEVFDAIDFPHSLGLLYSALTAFLGFHVNEGEYKVMGLAPYGTPRFAEGLRALVPAVEGGLFRLDLAYFAHDRSLVKGWTERLEELLGPPNPPHRRLQPENLEPAEFQRFADIAASLQLVLEERLFALARRVKERTGERVLCYGGGVALNAVANGKLARSGLFERVLVHPAAGDAGGALGAALAYAASRGVRIQAGFHPYLGLEARADDGLGAPEGTALGPALQQAELAEDVAERLAADQVVGWAHGRAEWGPRALGARSILARPDPPGQKDRLNGLVKHREGYRPFAPIVLDEHAGRVFEGFSPGRELERHMLATVTTRPEWRARLAAVTHVDGSARVQALRREDSPLLHEVLTRFHAKTGLPVLVNTSFNHAGEPIVNDARDAVASFERCRLDALVLPPRILARGAPVARGVRP